MYYFTTSKLFLLPSFDIEVEEQRKIDKFLLFLDNSGVGKIINKYIKNETSKGGRPSCNYYRLFATILYGFAFDKCTLRELETACKFDLRYITLMEQIKIDYTTISKFINKVIVPNEKEIFSKLCLQIKKEAEIEFDDAFIDGTKFEANANKYKFVWKPVTYHKNISVKVNEIIKNNYLINDYREEEMVRSSTIALAISNPNIEESSYKALFSMLTKVLEYEEKERLCGPNRKSYYKTDIDATAMVLKADYYSGKGSNMHAAYNVQILVIKGYVFSYYVSQSRTDINDFIPTIDSFYSNYSTFPKRICADSCYGTPNNYKYLYDNKIENYVKFQSYEGIVTGSNPECYKINKDETITCLNGNIGYEVKIDNRHPKKAKSVFFRIEGCNECEFKMYCKRFMSDVTENFKVFECNKIYQLQKQEALENLLSCKGIEMRVNRSIQVEGTFGIQKKDYGRTRYRRRGLERVSTETMLNFLGHNIAKLFRYFENNKHPNYWVAPENFDCQKIKKPSWKRLSKKGTKTHEKVIKKK